MVLEGPRDDLGRAGAVAVHQHDERQVGVLGGLGGPVVLVRVRDAAARVDHHVAAGQEPVGDLDGLVERAAGVVAQVEHQPLHPLLGQLRERVAHLAVARLGELGQPDVPGLRVDHERAAHRRDVDVVALDVQIDEPRRARAPDRDVHLGALLAAQRPHRLVARPAVRVLALDPRDDVAPAQALLVGGRALEQAHHGDVAVDDDDADAEAVVVPFLPLAHLRVGPRVHEVRVRIQRLQHAVDGAVHQPGGVHRLGVVVLDGSERGGEDAVLLADLVLVGQGPAPEQPAHQRRDEHRQHPDREPAITAHDCIVTDKPCPGNEFRTPLRPARLTAL